MHIRNSLILAALLAGCASAPTPEAPQKPTEAPSAEKVAEAPSATVVYYAGTVAVTSPDGATPYGPPKPGLVKRELFPGEGRIVESTLDDGQMRVTTLTQREGNVFDATDTESSFSGTITFSPDPWNATSWAYDLTMADGSGKIVGTATIDAQGIKTEKFFVTATGEKQARITDDLATTTQEKFDAAVPKPASPDSE